MNSHAGPTLPPATASISLLSSPMLSHKRALSTDSNERTASDSESMQEFMQLKRWHGKLSITLNPFGALTYIQQTHTSPSEGPSLARASLNHCIPPSHRLLAQSQPHSPELSPLISATTNHQGFTYHLLSTRLPRAIFDGMRRTPTRVKKHRLSKCRGRAFPKPRR